MNASGGVASRGSPFSCTALFASANIAPVLFSRIATLDEQQQDRFMRQVQSDPQAKRVFEKMQAFSR